MSGEHPTRVLGAGESWLKRHRALAELALASGHAQASRGPGHARNLAFLPAEALDLDLSDPLQCDFGDYHLLEKLGQGGMGVVYRARQRSLDREVALKLLAAGPWASADFIERFRREAQSAARMQHPNIVPVYEIGNQDSLNYFSMGLVRGESLAQRIARRGPLPGREAAQLMRTIAEAVDYAHRLGVLHLDLKPGNVLIDETGVPMVADFGLARRLDEAMSGDEDEVCGTPSYMAPEQAAGAVAGLSPATDIHGLGAILYECLCGRPPFVGATPMETLERLVREAPVPPRQWRAGIDPDLEAICLRCLAKSPAERYPDARALAEDLGRFLDGREVSVRPLPALQRLARWAGREPRLAAALGAFLLALAGGLLASSYQWQRAEGNAVAARDLLWEGRREAALQLESEGRGFEALPRLLANLAEMEPGDPAAADEQRVGLLLGQAPVLIDRMVLADANPLALALSAGGRLLAVASNDLSVRWFDTATLAERGRVSLAGFATSDGQPRTPMLLRFIGEDRLLVTLEWYSNLVHPASSDSWLIDLDRQRIVEPPSAFPGFADAAYSADAGLALLRDRERRVQLWQVDPWQPLSGMYAPEPEQRVYLIDPAGRYLAHLRNVQGRLLVQEAAIETGSAVERARAEWGFSAWATSSDGARIALGTFDGRLSLLETSNWAERPLPVNSGRQITWIGFSADDRWLAAANADGAVQLHDVQTGAALVAGVLRHDFLPTRIGLDRNRRLLAVAGAGRVALWRIPLPGAWVAPAIRLGSLPLGHELAGRYSVDWDFASGLLASAGLDGHVRLWRLPADPLLPVRAAHQLPEQMRFLAGGVVDVAWDRMRLVGHDGHPQSPWVTLPQPPGFAERIGDRVVLTLADRLEVRDARDPAQVLATVALPGSPHRLLPLGPDGARLLLGFGESGPGHAIESLRIVSLDPPLLRPFEARLDGPLRLVRESPDHTRIVAIGGSDAETTVLRSSDLGVLADYPHDSEEPVQWAAFDPGSKGLWLARRAVDPRIGTDAILAWQPGREPVTPDSLPSGLRPLAALPLPAGLFIFGSERDELLRPDGSRVELERFGSGQASAALAVSPDRRIIAQGFRDSVLLRDAATGDLLGVPLRAGIGAVDGLALLAFSPDSRRLIGRSLHGRVLVWSIHTPRAEAEAVGADLARVLATQDRQRVLLMPGTEERRVLRARDPGAWGDESLRPEPVIGAWSETREPIPRRDPTLPPHLLDMGDRYEMAPETVHTPMYRQRATLRPYPAGRQRIDSVEFDIRGMYHIASDAPIYGYGSPTRPGRPLECLPVPSTVGSVAAFHFLGLYGARNRLPPGTVVGEFRLRYQDHGQAHVALLSGQHFPGFGRDDPAAMVFAADPSFVLTGLPASEGLSVTRIANPEPSRPVKCIDMYFVDNDAALLVFGVTAEPLPLSSAASNGVQDN